MNGKTIAEWISRRASREEEMNKGAARTQMKEWPAPRKNVKGGSARGPSYYNQGIILGDIREK